MVGVRVDRKRKQSVTVLLKALGWDDAKILEEFGDYESIRADPGEGPHHRPGRRAARHLPQAAPGRAADPRGRADAAGEPLLQPEALRPRQGRPLQGEQEARAGPAARPERAHHRRHRRDDPVHRQAARRRDRDARRRPGRHASRVEVDDIDHFGNRRLRTVGELIQNQVRTGLSRMERVVRERMTTQDVEAITPQTLINIRPVVASHQGVLRDLPASASSWTRPTRWPGLTHKRRLSALGPGGLSRERAGFEVRDVHTVALRPDVPDRDPGGPEHRPDRLAVDLRADQRRSGSSRRRTARSRTARSPTRSTT